MSTVDLRSFRARPRQDLVSALAARWGWSWARSVRRAAECVLGWQERARQRHQLQCLSDHMLRDIGLTRADILAESTRPFLKAPPGSLTLCARIAPSASASGTGPNLTPPPRAAPA